MRRSEAFPFLLRYPGRTLLAMLALVIIAGAGLSKVRKDPSVDAFVPDNHPAAAARDIAEAVFGLEDPVIVALAAMPGDNAFTPAGLSALRRMDAGIRGIDGVKKNSVVSLASENAIFGTNGDLEVEPILASGAEPITEETAALAWSRFQAMPMLPGLLASAAGDLLIIIAPVEDPDHAAVTTEAIQDLVVSETPPGFTPHVAGVAAMNARLGTMVDTDTRIFVPIAVLTVLFILYIALRQALGLVGPLVVIAGSAAFAIGIMGWVGASYYLITTALPVVIMAIAVADSLHICTYYLKARADDARCSARQAAIGALEAAWLPVTLTSITTVAAFIGLSFGAAMQPISEFGWFAALGVVAAWVLSLTVLPAILVLTDLKPSASSGSIARETAIDRAIAAVTSAAFRHPTLALGGVVLAVALLALLGSQARFDYERQKYFTPDDAVRVADYEINRRLGGVNFLDVVVSASAPGGLMTPQSMADIAHLRRDLERLPLVHKVNGIDQYISLMHSTLTGAATGTLPDRARAPGQYMFLYETSGAPEDFKQEIDYDYRRALLRAQLSTDRYSQTRLTVAALSELTQAWSARSGLQADISGRVAVNTGWMDQLSETHFRGLGLAIVLVLAATLLVFRSVSYALLAMVPVLVGVVAVYATMGTLGVDIAPATSMTAAIATGLGVDFGIHLISIVRRQRKAGVTPREAFTDGYFIVARACFYSAAALSVALAVICVSSAPPLRWFGMLVSIGAAGSLFGALVIVPALWSARFQLLNRRALDAGSA